MRYLARALAALAVLAALLPAQENLGRGRISGDVVDEAGAGVPGVLIVAQSLQSTARLESRTDKKGHFAVGGLGSGTWRVTASKDGYVDAYTEMPVSQLRANPSIKLTLKTAAPVRDESRGKGATELDKGQALLDAGKFDEALEAFERYAADHPEEYGIRLSIATALSKKGDADRAQAEFQGVLDKTGQAGEAGEKERRLASMALAGIGELAVKRGDLTAAQQAFSRVLELSPGDAAAAYNVGEIFFSNQKVDEAVTYLERAAQIKKDWPKVHQKLGYVYLNKGDFAKALENLKRFLELDPQSPEAASVRSTIAAIEQMKK